MELLWPTYTHHLSHRTCLLDLFRYRVLWSLHGPSSMPSEWSGVLDYFMTNLVMISNCQLAWTIYFSFDLSLDAFIISFWISGFKQVLFEFQVVHFMMRTVLSAASQTDKWNYILNVTGCKDATEGPLECLRGLSETRILGKFWYSSYFIWNSDTEFYFIRLLFILISTLDIQFSPMNIIIK